MKNNGIKRHTVRFGGETRELWTNEGLIVTNVGAVELIAVMTDEGWQAEAPVPRRGGDVKAEVAEYSRAFELSCRINAGRVPPLTLAYFRAAAEAGTRALSSPGEVNGGYEALILPETLRLLLDERGLSWDEAAGAVSRSFIYRARSSARVTLGAIRALSPRTAGLISAVNEKLCERLWAAHPGDWARIAASAVIKEGEVDLPFLCAAMCGEIKCSEEKRTGAFRTFYSLWPAKFIEDDDN